MDDRPPLQPGSHILCPHCRAWHRLIRPHTEGTDYTERMLYFECAKGRYYAGQVGQTSRHRTRGATNRKPRLAVLAD